MPPENTSHMILCYNSVLLFAQIEVRVMPIRKFVRSASFMKMNTGPWCWSESLAFSPWERVQKCLLRRGDELEVLRTAFLNPRPLMDVELTDDKSVLLKPFGAPTSGDDDDDSAKIFITLVMLEGGIPSSFAANPYDLVCWFCAL